ncbi:XdhC family protein [Pseudomonadota bacterium]
MKATELNVLENALKWCRQGKQPWLCTIVKTIGSSPRPPGSMLVTLAGSKSPIEISVALMAELIKLRTVPSSA